MKLGRFPSGSKKKNTCIFGWKKKACGTVWTTMPFFVAVLSFKRKKILYASSSCRSFLKNDDSGKAALTSLEEDATATEETQEKVSFGSLF